MSCRYPAARPEGAGRALHRPNLRGVTWRRANSPSCNPREFFEGGTRCLSRFIPTRTEGDLPSHTDTPRPQAWKHGPRRFHWNTFGVLLIITCFALGVWFRIGYLVSWTTNSDQSVVGLMAMSIRHGHQYAFFWGQAYGGVEPYVVAIVFTVFGQSAFALGLTPIVLVGIASLLTWRIALRLVSDRWLAGLAGAFVWVVPAFGATQAKEYGFRDAALVCGLTALLMALRILDDRRSLLDFFGWGLAVGLGWWASPESIYFSIPSIALIIGAVVSSHRLGNTRGWSRGAAIAACAAVLGALPWLWANVRNGLQSLNAASESAPTDGGYVSHLHIFLTDVLPMELGIRRYGSGALIPPGAFGVAVAYHCLHRGSRRCCAVHSTTRPQAGYRAHPRGVSIRVCRQPPDLLVAGRALLDLPTSPAGPRGCHRFRGGRTYLESATGAYAPGDDADHPPHAIKGHHGRSHVGIDRTRGSQLFRSGP